MKFNLWESKWENDWEGMGGCFSYKQSWWNLIL